jgi:hypothetical protein
MRKSVLRLSQCPDRARRGASLDWIAEVNSAKPQTALRTAALRGAVAGDVAVRRAFAGSFLGGLFLFAHGGLHLQNRGKFERQGMSFLPLQFKEERCPTKP